MPKIDPYFVSDIDTTLAAFDAIHPKTASQQTEIDKYRRIQKLRDKPSTEPEEVEDIWDC